VARTDWCILVTERAFEYNVRNDCERLGFSPYLPQARRKWHSADNTILTKLVPAFSCALLLPLAELDLATLKLVPHLRQPSPVLTDACGRPWLIFGSVLSALLLSEMTREFDHDARPAPRTSRQANADLRVAHGLPRRLAGAVHRDSAPAVRQLVSRLAHVHAAQTAAAHAAAGARPMISTPFTAARSWRLRERGHSAYTKPLSG
jgi:hypothetical protein